MLELKGNNLPQRQQELNRITNEAITNKIKFNDIQSLEEHSDVDRLFKIDVASKYRNSEYIIEQLKCGDTLYISRALKSEWLYGDDFSHIINPDYLHHNIFPWMSIKMKNKMLNTIACQVRNEIRMLDFYKYCNKFKLEDISFKFLIFTSETYKLEYLNSVNLYSFDKQNFFGNSFDLVDTYLGKLRDKQICTNNKIVKFSYLYSVSQEKYLNLLETYTQEYNYNQKLGLRISKSIMTKHKQRVLGNPTLYIKYLNMNIVVKHSTADDAMQYAIALLPCSIDEFWSMHFYKSYTKILNLLPYNEIYHFLKQIFMEKYGNHKFEMSLDFYQQKYYQLFTIEERELWALKHLEQKNELLGAGEDFLWYQFVNFDRAFKEIKKYIYKTMEKNKRCEIVNVLISSVRNDQHLETLIKYYYERHVNELEYNKQAFINKVVELHNVFKFNEPCWNVFNKILHSMKNFAENYMTSNKALAIIYCIIHNKEISDIVQMNKIHDIEIDYCFKPFFRYLTEDQIKLIYDYYINLFNDKLQEFDGKEYDNDENKVKICNIIDGALNFLISFNKTKHDCPDIIYKYINLDPDRYKYTKLFVAPKSESYSEASLIRLLKQDSTVFLKTLSDVIDSFKNYMDFFYLNNIMKKMRIYFSNDLAKDCVQLLETYLLQENFSHEFYIAFAVINSIFVVANDNYKIDFMLKYAPEGPKISYDTIDPKTLKIQECICRFVYYSRPPIPLPVVLKFIKGDYLSYCLPMLNSYVANLPKVRCLQFITAILDAPVSVQKHGLRLAFRFFSAEDLQQLIVDVWKNSKNISLRKILYKSLFDHIKSADTNLQQSFYDILKIFTMDLHEDDDDEVFSLFSHYLPESFKGDFLETAWSTIKKFSDNNSKNIDRKTTTIKEIENHIQHVNKEFCRINILDDLVDSTLFRKNVEMSNSRYIGLIRQKWNLATKYISHYDNDEEMGRSMEFVTIIIKRSIEISKNFNIKFTMYTFLDTFLKKVLQNFCLFKDKNPGATPMLEYIVNELLNSMPMNEMYLLYWNFSITIIFIKVIRPLTIDLKTKEEMYKDLNSNEIATKFANELFVFIISLKEKYILYNSFFDNIAVTISEVTDTVLSHFLEVQHINNLPSLIIDLLTDFQMTEMYMLAVMLFFERHSKRDCYNSIELIYDKVIKFDNEEVKAVMYQKLLSKSGIYF